MAMRDEEVFFVFLVLAMFAFGAWLFTRFRTRQEQLKTIQQVIASGKMDETTRKSLLESLSSAERRSNQMWDVIVANAGRVTRMVVAIAGWLTFVISTGALVAVLMTDDRRRDDEIFVAVIFVGVGFALITLPMALREIESRRLG